MTQLSISSFFGRPPQAKAAAGPEEDKPAPDQAASVGGGNKRNAPAPPKPHARPAKKKKPSRPSPRANEEEDEGDVTAGAVPPGEDAEAAGRTQRRAAGRGGAGTGIAKAPPSKPPARTTRRRGQPVAKGAEDAGEEEAPAAATRVPPLDDEKQRGKEGGVAAPTRRSSHFTKADIPVAVEEEEEEQQEASVEIGEEDAEAGGGLSADESGDEDEGQGQDVGGAGPGAGGVSDFERQRLERIARNRAMMASLGIAGGLNAPSPSKKPKPPPRKKPPKQRQPEPSAPSRRSLRARGVPGELAEASLLSAGVERYEEPPEEPEEDLVFDDSSVKRYVCRAWDGGLAAAVPPAGPVPDSARLSGFAALPGTFFDASLKRVYTVDRSDRLLVAAGHQGRASVYGLGEGGGIAAGAAGGGGGGDDDDVVEPLLSCQLCKTWVADVKLVDGQREGATLLLSASNNGDVVLWDINQCARSGKLSTPRSVAQVEVHASGIFQMHELGGRILTASKDATVGLSTIHPDGSISTDRRLSGAHAGVIKTARWRSGGDVFASGGNDGRVCVGDARLADDAAACTLSIADVHDKPVCCVEWHPSTPHLLLSAGNDTRIYLHDTRKPKVPLYAFSGHHRPGLKACKSITRPIFVGGGRAIATTGEQSPHLSLYCTRTGATISRGEIDVNATTVFVGEGDHSALVLGSTSGLLQYKPVWD